MCRSNLIQEHSHRQNPKTMSTHESSSHAVGVVSDSIRPVALSRYAGSTSIARVGAATAGIAYIPIYGLEAGSTISHATVTYQAASSARISRVAVYVNDNDETETVDFRDTVRTKRTVALHTSIRAKGGVKLALTFEFPEPSSGITLYAASVSYT